MVGIPDLLVSTAGFGVSEVVPQGNILQSVGAAGSAIGTYMVEKRERDTDLFINENLYKFKNDQLAKFEDFKLKHDDIDSFTDTFDKQFDEASGQLLTSAGDGINSEKLQDKLRQIKSAFIENSINYQVNEKAVIFKQGREQAADDIIKGALINGNFNGAREELQGIYDTMADQTTPAELEDYRNRTSRNLATSRIKQAIESKPESVDNLIVEYQDDLDAADVDGLRNQAVAQSKIIEAQYEKHLAKRQDRNRFEIYTKILENPASVDATVLKAMVKNNDIDPDDAEGLLKLRNSGEEVKDDLYVLSNIDQKRNLGTLTVSDIIKQHAAGKLTQSTAQDYIKSVNSGVLNSPAAKQALELIESAYEKEAFGVMSPEDQAALVKDKQELWERMSTQTTDEKIKKQSPVEIADDIISRNQQSNAAKEKMRREIRQYKKLHTDLTSRSDYEKRKASVLNAFNSKRMTQAESEVEFNILNEILKDMAE